MCCDILRFCWCDWPTVCSNILRFVGVRMGRLVKLLQHVIFCVCRSGRVLVATFLFRWSCVCAIMCRCVVRSFLDVVHGFCEIVVTFGSIVLRKRHVRHVGCCCCCCCCCCACDMCCDILRFCDVRIFFVFQGRELEVRNLQFKNPSKENRFQAQAMFLDDACTVISSVFVIAFFWSCVCHTGIYQVSVFVGVGEAT